MVSCSTVQKHRLCLHLYPAYLLSHFSHCSAHLSPTHADSPHQEWVPGGELFHHLDIAGVFEEPTACFFAANVLLALDFLHNKVRWEGGERGTAWFMGVEA